MKAEREVRWHERTSRHFSVLRNDVGWRRSQVHVKVNDAAEQAKGDRRPGLRLDLECKIMCRVFPMLFGVSAFVPSAAYVAADQTNPEVVRAVAYTT